MIVLVCGGRRFEDARLMRATLIDAGLTASDVLIHGGATGADAHAEYEARAIGCHSARVDPLWNRHGKAAGPLRNAAMLRLKPDKVLAFPGGRGTENCVKQAEEAGIPVERISEQQGGEG